MLLAVGSAIAWQPQMADPSYQLLTKADETAMEWIKANTPPTAKFLVNAFPAYGGALLAGNDAGWWLTYATGRQTNLPPLTYGSERMESASGSAAVNAFGVALRGKPLTDLSPIALDLTTAAHLDLLRKEGFAYVYIGAHLNPSSRQADAIDAQKLRDSPNFKLVYEQGGVEIFQLER